MGEPASGSSEPPTHINGQEMLTASAEFAADFYNNVAAIAVVLMFTKVVAHRSRKVPRKTLGTWILAALHVTALVAATVAIVASLRATDEKSEGGYHCLAWLGLVTVGAILVADIAIDEVCAARRLTEDQE
jgi:hypothetical protein